MYEHEGLNDILFLMLYGGAALLAVVACLYLLFSRGNVMSSKVTPPRFFETLGRCFYGVCGCQSCLVGSTRHLLAY